MSQSSPRSRGTGGPGRGTPRSRAAVRRDERASRTSSAPQSSSSTPAEPRGRAVAAQASARVKGSVAAVRGLGFTRRMVAVLVVLGMLALSYVSSLTVFFRQQQQIAQTKAKIAAQQADLLTLQDEIKRWKDPDFVKAQARSRLGWVVPGETGYRVIGPDGKPLGGGVEIETEGELPSDEHPTVWWERLSGSVKAADNPVPEKEQADEVIKPPASATPKPKPSPSR